MINPKDVLDMPSGNITAFVEALKTVITLLGVAITGVAGILVHRNTKVTQANTDNGGVVKESLAGCESKVSKLERSINLLSSKVQSLEASVQNAEAQLLKSVNEVKIVEVKVSSAVREHLSGITSVQRLLEHRISQNEMKVDLANNTINHFIDGLERLRNKKQ